MDRGLAIALTAGVGGLIALQAPINGHLGQTIGTWQATLFSFLVGTVLLTVVVAFSKGSFGQMGDVRNVSSWVYLTGGVIGMVYVATVLVTVRNLGAGGVTAATIAGQLTIAVVIDHFGLLGLDRSPVTMWKIVGVLFLALGTFLVIHN